MGQLPIADDLLDKLNTQGQISLSGMARLPKGLVAAALAQKGDRPLLVVTATLEEAGRWSTQLEAMGWKTVHFYPTTEASPYEPFESEDEIVWGQLQILTDLVGRASEGAERSSNIAVVATERALQTHLPPPEVFREFCFQLHSGDSLTFKQLSERLSRLGYERVTLVEKEGQWSRRGDIIDIYPISTEWPVRLEFFGDEVEKIREFDPATQRSQDTLSAITLTPTSFSPIVLPTLRENAEINKDIAELVTADAAPTGLRRFLGLVFEHPASLADYLPTQAMVVIDEPDQCAAHCQQWVNHVDEQWQALREQQPYLCQLHRSFGDCTQPLEAFKQVCLTELVTDNSGLDLSGRALPSIPHQFGTLSKTIRDEIKHHNRPWIVSAQPSRSAALLQEHDCPAQYVPNPNDFPAIDKLGNQQVPVALKYSGLAEVQGFVLPTFRTLLVTDREFFGQQSLSTPTYIRKRRRAVSKAVDPNQLKPGDFVVHKNHGIGRFLKLESLTLNNETREYLAIQYADGVLRVAADQLNTLSRFRSTGGKKPALHKMQGKTWEKTKNKVRKAIQKVAFDLLDLYAKRAEQQGFPYPTDSPWQQEMEDSFPYQPTPDQLKATQDVKLDMESNRPMDRLVCGDVGFGKTEVAIRSMFKAVTSGKQAALLAPTTILAQQHYHTLRERFAPYPIEIGLLNRFRSAGERKEIQQRLASGELDIVVGTHQLLGKAVKFKDLGLLVVDEEQRFGVNQKEKIKTLKTQVDVLTLSATPIPRTLYMALSGVREMSLITTPPPSRRPIKTHLSPYDSEKVHAAIRQELDRGGQIFYVVNRVEGIEEIAGRLRQMIPSLRIAIAHGQMAEGELEATMIAFNNGEADLLVCTTIIESGLDIPRVNTILVENAETFGLSQLYQLRGRVGRAGIQAHAWLFYRKDRQLTDDARKRLRAIQEFTQLGSGYQLAMRDMEIRGVGNLLGAQQSGQMNAIGFDLYMDMLNEAIAKIRGQEIPTVDDTQVDLSLTAMIPAKYIPDSDLKMSAYRQVAAASSRAELKGIAADWTDRFGTLPKPVEELLRVMELKYVAKSLGFARVKPVDAHVVLETPMEEPAWDRLKEALPVHLRSRFVYQPGKVTVRGLGSIPAGQQLEFLIQWLDKMGAALEDPVATVN